MVELNNPTGVQALTTAPPPAFPASTLRNLSSWRLVLHCLLLVLKFQPVCLSQLLISLYMVSHSSSFPHAICTSESIPSSFLPSLSPPSLLPSFLVCLDNPWGGLFQPGCIREVGVVLSCRIPGFPYHCFPVLCPSLL